MILKIKIKFQFIQFIYVKSGSKNAPTKCRVQPKLLIAVCHWKVTSRRNDCRNAGVDVGMEKV